MNPIALVFDAITYLFLLRFALQAAQADFFNPISQWVIRLTKPFIKPLNAILPDTQRFNTAALLLAFLAQLLVYPALMAINGSGFELDQRMIAAASIGFLYAVLNFYFIIAIVFALMSWVVRDPNHPVFNLLNAILAPLMRPIQAIIPPMGGLDFSLIVVLFAISAIKNNVLPVLIAQLGL